MSSVTRDTAEPIVFLCSEDTLTLQGKDLETSNYTRTYLFPNFDDENPQLARCLDYSPPRPSYSGINHDVSQKNLHTLIR